MRIQLHHGVNDLAGARINVALPHRPSPSGAVRPLDGGIANVHRVSAFGQIFDAQRVLESRLLERRIPPQRSHPRRGTDRLRNGAVEIKHNRLYRLAERGIRIFFLQAPAIHQVTRERLIVGLGKILKAGADESYARDPAPALRIPERAWPQTNGARGRSSECGSGWFKSLSESVAKVSSASTSVLSGKLPVCSRSMTLRSLSSRQSAALDDCSRIIDAAHGAGGPAQLRKQIERVADQQGIGVHQHRAIALRFDRKRSQHGSRETVFHGMLQLRRAIGSAETGVLLDHQHAHPNPPEAAHRARSEGTPVGEGLDRTDAAAQSGEIKKLSLKRRRR